MNNVGNKNIKQLLNMFFLAKIDTMEYEKSLNTDSNNKENNGGTCYSNLKSYHFQFLFFS